MPLWKELLIAGLQNEIYEEECINDEMLERIIKESSYRILLKIQETLDDEKLSDEDCFMKIEEIILILERNNISCNRHDFG